MSRRANRLLVGLIPVTLTACFTMLILGSEGFSYSRTSRLIGGGLILVILLAFLMLSGFIGDAIREAKTKAQGKRSTGIAASLVGGMVFGVITGIAVSELLSILVD